MIIVYGTRTFTKHMGYFGENTECENCHKEYPNAYVKYSTWMHICYIPLFPVKKSYYKKCPICGNGVELKSKVAKAEMKSLPKAELQLEVYAKHVLANKPKKLFATDTSYELWVKDLSSGEDICVATGITKSRVKEIKKARGLKKLEIKEVK